MLEPQHPPEDEKMKTEELEVQCQVVGALTSEMTYYILSVLKCKVDKEEESYKTNWTPTEQFRNPKGEILLRYRNLFSLKMLCWKQ